MRNTDHYLAIIGFGARGLHALELFFIALSTQQSDYNESIIIYESRESLGTGTAWDPSQVDVNLINISDRALESLSGRPSFKIKDTVFPAFPSFINWMEDVMGHSVDPVKDTFVPRKVMGTYLSNRTNSLIEPLKSLGLLIICHERVIDLSKRNSKFFLKTSNGNVSSFEKVILALGHLSTETSKQNKNFLEHAKQSEALIVLDPYSEHAYTIYKSSKTFAIKGMGLAMIDVVGMVITHHKGEFIHNEDDIYLKYSGTNNKIEIVPFSLDGLIVVPKPLGGIIDSQFNSKGNLKNELVALLKEKLEKKSIKGIEDILSPIAEYMTTIYFSFDKKYSSIKSNREEIKKLIINWLLDPNISNDQFIDTKIPVVDYMKITSEMAFGIMPYSLDFTIGQVWRQLQPDLYNIYSHSNLNVLTMAELIEVDEKLKRYSYGPPVESILQLIALHDVGILNLNHVMDPKITLTKKGYELINNDLKVECNSLVDAVLASPNLDQIDDPLIKSIQQKQIAEQFEENLGFKTSGTKNHMLGSVLIEDLYSIGRNTKGSVYGVDAILECFNDKKLNGMIEKILKGVKYVSS